ncbi:hypothetical protein ACA087_00840 [Pseudomonas chlororaphis]|uniref:hypothetical protein n=1 Tax=Pseudomonas chlororaphis TaxID=587753 RepID=UPI00352A19CE
MKIYAQFSSEDQLEIVTVFAGPQDPEFFPNISEIEDDDPRYLEFLSAYPK